MTADLLLVVEARYLLLSVGILKSFFGDVSTSKTK